MKKRFFLFLNLFFTALVHAQSPGGISANLNLWIKANAGVTTSGSNVTTWADQSPNGYTYTSGGIKPTLTTDGLNYNYVVTFPGNQNLMSTTDVSYADWTAYFVVRGVDAAANSCLLSNGTRAIKYEQWNNTTKYGYTAYAVADYVSTVTTAFGNHEILQLDHLSSSTNVNFYSQYGGAISSAAVNCASTDRRGPIYSLGGGDTDFFTGVIAEVIMYNTQITNATTKNRIESYLAIKYGIEKNQLTDYLASNGTTKMWNSTATNASTFRYDIAGIGRDNTSGLGQIKSKSSNADGLLTISADGEGTNYAPSYVDMADLEFLTFGNNNGAVSWTITGAPAGYQISSRQWLAQEVGEVGNCTFAFDVANATFNIPVPFQSKGYYIIYDTDVDGLLSDETPIQLYDDGTNGDAIANDNVFSKSGINAANGALFTIATTTALTNSPGGVTNNLKLWLRSNYGVTGTTNVTAWDGFANGFNATAATGPALQTTDINYNPSLQFDGSTKSMLITGGIMGASTYTDANVYTVGRVNAISNSFLFSEGLASAGRFSSHIPWGDNTLYWDAGTTAAPNRISIAWGGTIATNYLWTLNSGTTAGITPFAHNQDIARNGLNIANDNTAAAFTGNNSNLTICYDGVGNFYNATVGELAIYTGAITGLEQQRIHSYLALKYGIALTNNNDADGTPNETISGLVREGDYVASDGSTIVWTYSANSAYNTNVAGMGRDDASGFTQKISGSVSGTADIIKIALDNDFTVANGSVSRTTNFTSDKSFLVWGNNNGATTFSTAEGTGNRMTCLWKQQKTGTVNAVYLKFTDSDISNSTPYYLIASTTAAVGSFSTLATATSSGAGNTITFGPVDITTKAFFTISTANGPLPIELLHFSATSTNDKKVNLNWTTATETNNDFFTLEKSKAGAIYEAVTNVKGAGNSSSIIQYSFTDRNPFSGVSYYRLKQTDYDGTFSYSKSVSVNIDNENEFSIQIIPNPFSSETTLLSDKNFKNVTLTVFNSFGQQVKQLKNNSGQTITLHRGNLVNGLYFIQITEGDNVFTAGKLIITD